MIQVSATKIQVFHEYHGDTTVARVREGVCVSSHINGQTGSVYVRNGPDPWPGATIDELNAAGFRYKWTTTEYRDSAGVEYYQTEDNGWTTGDQDYSADEVRITS